MLFFPPRTYSFCVNNTVAYIVVFSSSNFCTVVFFLQVILSVLFIVVTITHDVCSRRRIPPLCLVRCASLWLGCEYDCRSDYQFISLIHPTVMETCTHNCEQQRLTCMQHSLDPICRTTARDMTLYAAFQKKANGTVSAATPSLNGPQGR